MSQIGDSESVTSPCGGADTGGVGQAKGSRGYSEPQRYL